MSCSSPTCIWGRPRRSAPPAWRPAGTTRENLARLDDLVEALDARRLVVLGDLFHARAAYREASLREVGAWRARRAGLAVTLVAGNHDARAGAPPSALGLELVEEPFAFDGLELRHQPLDDDGRRSAGARRPFAPRREAERAGTRQPAPALLRHARPPAYSAGVRRIHRREPRGGGRDDRALRHRRRTPPSHPARCERARDRAAISSAAATPRLGPRLESASNATRHYVIEK